MQRWNFPYKSLEIAKLYLRTADYSMQKPCGIYEISNNKGRISYKIFSDITALQTYLDKNKDKSCALMKPVYMRENYNAFPNTQVKFLGKDEVDQYLLEQENEA